MAVQDDLRRLSQLDSIYLGESFNGVAAPITSWHKGRLQQANDGTWVFRSRGSDGAVVGFRLGPISPQWTSTEAPSSGIQVTIPMTTMGAPIGSVYLAATITNGIDQLKSRLTKASRSDLSLILTQRWR